MTADASAVGLDLVELHLPIPGNERTVMIAVDRTRVRSVNAHKLSLVGRLGSLHVAIDRYPAVDDGEEVYVRLLDLEAEVERWHLVAASAGDGTTCAEPVVAWPTEGQGFTVNLTSRPPLVVLLDGAGAVVTRPATLS